jgi:hypothetical protein
LGGCFGDAGALRLECLSAYLPRCRKAPQTKRELECVKATLYSILMSKTGRCASKASIFKHTSPLFYTFYSFDPTRRKEVGGRRKKNIVCSSLLRYIPSAGNCTRVLLLDAAYQRFSQARQSTKYIQRNQCTPHKRRNKVPVVIMVNREGRRRRKRLLTCRVSLQACVPNAVLPCRLNMRGGRISASFSSSFHLATASLPAWMNPPAHSRSFTRFGRGGLGIIKPMTRYLQNKREKGRACCVFERKMAFSGSLVMAEERGKILHALG